MFSIAILPGIERDGNPVAEIMLGDFVEDFPLIVHFWSPEQYCGQWREAVERIVVGGDNAISALIVDIDRPGRPGGLTWWPMYRAGTKVYFHQQLLFFDSLSEPFEYEDPYASVPLRVEGSEVSEWMIPLSSLEAFLEGKG